MNSSGAGPSKSTGLPRSVANMVHGDHTNSSGDQVSFNLQFLQFIEDLNIELSGTKFGFDNESKRIEETLQCSKQSAQRLIAISNIKKLSSARAFLNNHKRLRCFDVFCFWQSSPGYKFHLDFLSRLCLLYTSDAADD